MRKLLLVCGILAGSFSSKGQILISLLLGDKLNSNKIEFGLTGGANFASIQGLSGSKSTPLFNLGFYFDIKLKNSPHLLLNTGVLVKSSMGASGITPYPLNNPDLDTLFKGGSVKRTLRYFNVPVLIKYKFKSNFFIETGVQLGLLYEAFDEFKQGVNHEEDLTFKNETRHNYHALDVGMISGLGFKLMKGLGMTFGARYYYGLANINKSTYNPSQYNRSLYLYACIPIGVGKSKKDREDQNNN
jgi:hypothetical protein